MVTQLGRQLEMDAKTLNWLTKSEILGLLAGIKVALGIIPERKRAYVILTEGKKLVEYRGERAETFAQKFFCEGKAEGAILKGIVANPGKAKGKARVWTYDVKTFDSATAFSKTMAGGDILVAETTSPEIMMACKKAAAILTNQGGLLSHAAIVSRKMGIPCIVGFGDVTHRVKDGDLVEVDADRGVVRKIESSATNPEPERRELFRVDADRGVVKIIKRA